jgi:uncharacterized protein DUF3105
VGSKGALAAVVSLLAAGAGLLAITSGGGVPVAYVAVAGNNHVQVIDLESGQTLRKIYAGITPWRLALAPGGRQLWVQHWYSETTAVIDLGDHEVVRTLPARGPGAFDAAGDRFLTFNWPGTGLDVVDARSFRLERQEVTEVSRVYDVAPDPHGSRLYLLQFDPMAHGPRERYGYVLGLPFPSSRPAPPTSYRTGRSPVRLRPIRSAPFLLTADGETNGLSLVNPLGDGRAIPTCPAPQDILLSPDESRLVVPCWREDGRRKSHLVAYRADFRSRPWPDIVEEKSAEIEGALVRGAFSPSGREVYLVDRTGHRLLEIDAGTLEIRRQFPTGDVPVDVVVTAIPRAARDRAAREGRSRQRLRDVLGRMRAAVRPLADLSWVEEIEETTGPAAAKTPPTEGEREPAARRRIRASYKPPDWLRLDLEDGSVRLAQGGYTVSIDPGARFWVTPRQETVSVLFGLANGDVEGALRRLAGDVPGSPYLRGGIAVDLVTEIREADGHYWLVGALGPGQRVSQLWVDAESGRPANLVESVPSFQPRGHGPGAFSGLVETKFYDFLPGGSPLPARMERTVVGRSKQRVRIVAAKVDAGLPDERFRLDRLGGIGGPRVSPFPPAGKKKDEAAPGLAIAMEASPYLPGPLSPHPPYTTQPPASGPRVSMLAEWGAHRVPIPPELSVHNLEHGGVALQYNCPADCSELVERLEQLAGERDFVLVAPYPWMTHRLALAAWGRLQVLETFDAGRVSAFLDAHAGKDHHRAADTASVR